MYGGKGPCWEKCPLSIRRSNQRITRLSIANSIRQRGLFTDCGGCVGSPTASGGAFLTRFTSRGSERAERSETEEGTRVDGV